MDWYWYLIIAIAAVLFAGLLVQVLIARTLFFKYLSKDNKQKDEEKPLDDEEKKMLKLGASFEKSARDYKRDVYIESEGLKLHGEYFDFRFKRAVILVAGRTETLKYLYYYAIPYMQLGYNILLVDNRAHGLSEGKFCCCGLEEYKDVINWVKYLHNTLRNEYIVGHGICIGSATILYALTDKNCPPYFQAMIADGIYTNFMESFRNHAYARKRPARPVSNFFSLYFKHYLKHNPNYGPIDVISKLNKPILFLHSKEDKFSPYAKMEEIYKLCKSPKKIVTFDKGAHSRLRINDENKYDDAIRSFVK